MFQQLAKQLNKKRIGLEEGHSTELTTRGYGMKVRWSEAVAATILSGKEAGPVEGSELPSGKTVELSFGTICPIKYNVVTSVSEELTELADVSCPTIFDPDEPAELKLQLRTRKAVPLAELSYLLKLYLID